MDIRLDKIGVCGRSKATPGKPISGSRTTTKSLSNEIRPRCLRHSLKRALHPNLVWTKRTGNGDTLRTRMAGWTVLDPDEIGQRNDVIDVLYLHHSKRWHRCWQNRRTVRTPEQMLMDYQDQLPSAVAQNRFYSFGHEYLKANIPALTSKSRGRPCGDQLSKLAGLSKLFVFSRLGFRDLQIQQSISIFRSL